MDAATISAIAEVIDAIPDGPYIVVESPFPALEQIGGGDINLGSTFGDVNFPFGEDFLDVHDETTTDESTNISVLDVGPDVVADSAIEQPEVIIDETVADSAIESAVAGEPGENVVDSAIVPADTGEIAMDSAVEPGEEADPDGFGEPAKPIFGSL